MVAIPDLAGRVAASPGDVLLTVYEPEPSLSGIGIGLEYDGARILYTHTYDNRIHFTDLTGVDLGQLVLMDPGGGNYAGDCCNAITYRGTDGALFGGGWGSSDLSRVDMTTGVITLVKADALNTSGGFIDGLAWDPTDNTFWMSNDESCPVEHLDEFGNDIGGFDGCVVTGYANSGLTVGLEGTLFYATASNGLIFALSTSTDPPTNLGVFSHTGGRDEDMSCGPLYTTGNGTVTTLLSQDAYANFFTVIEMPPGMCVVPGTVGRDLRISSTDLTVEPDRGSTWVGTPQWINATVWNLGTVDVTDSFVVDFTVGGPPDADDDGVLDPGITILGSVGITNSVGDPIPPSGSKTASFLWSDPPVGVHDLWAVVDYPANGTVDEGNQTAFEILNNRAKYNTSLVPAGSGPPNATAPPDYEVHRIPLSPPRNVRTTPAGQDVVVSWSPPVDARAVDYYEVYGGPSPVTFDLVTPIFQTPDASWNAWTEVGRAAGPGEFYYVVRSVNATDNARSETSNSAGAFTVPLLAGMNAISVPLQPYSPQDIRLGGFLAATGATRVESLDAAGAWQALADPNATLDLGEAFLVDLPAPSLYTFVGFPGAHLRYREGFGFAAGRDGLRVDMVGSDARLTWPAVAGAVDYLVYKSDRRDGFFGSEGTDYMAGPAGNVTTTTWALGATAETYYMVVPIDVNGSRGASSYSVGIVPLVLAGSDGWGLPFRPFPENAGWTADDFTADFGAMGVLHFTAAQEWVPHFAEMPFGVYDVTIVQAAGYQTTVAGTRTVWFFGH